jgi:hypothetical protein
MRCVAHPLPRDGTDSIRRRVSDARGLPIRYPRDGTDLIRRRVSDTWS